MISSVVPTTKEDAFIVPFALANLGYCGYYFNDLQAQLTSDDSMPPNSAAQAEAQLLEATYLNPGLVGGLPGGRGGGKGKGRRRPKGSRRSLDHGRWV